MPEEIDVARLREEAEEAGYTLRRKRTVSRKVRLSVQIEEPNYIKLRAQAQAQKKSMNKILNGLIEEM